MPVQVGITGGIGSGKSTVAAIFSSLGVPVYDADSRAKVLMNTDRDLIKSIQNEFGNESYTESGKLNRKYLADHVFGFPERLKKLNRLVHPQVAKDYLSWVSTNKSSAYVLKEAALLYESGTAKGLDKVIVVTAPEAVRINRVMKRDGRSEADVKNIIDRQLPQTKIQSLADFVIVNDESMLVVPQVLEIHKQLSQTIPV